MKTETVDPNYQFQIDPDVNCVFVKHTNKLTVDIIFNRYEDIFSDPQMRPNLNYLINYAESDNQMEPRDIRSLADFLNKNKEIRGECMHAVLSGTRVGYGYSRMLDSLYNAGQTDKKREVKTLIFNISEYADPNIPLQEAMKWLGIPIDYVFPFQMVQMGPNEACYRSQI